MKSLLEKFFQVHVTPPGVFPASKVLIVGHNSQTGNLAPLLVEFANEAPKPVIIGFCNEISIGADGWAQIAPFCDKESTALMPDENGKVKKKRAIQRIDKAGCEAMVADFYNERRGIRKFLKGCNIYVGHPDAPDIGKFYPDKEPKGVFADLEVREDGLYGLPVFTNEGSEIVESKKLRAFSGRFGESEPIGEVNGLPAYRPTKIYSAGLTNSPHLPVHFFNADDSLADEAATQQHQNTMKKKLLALIAALSLKPQFANAEAPTEAEQEAALDLINNRVTEFANEQTTIKQRLLALCGKVGITFANEAAITDSAATLAQVADKVVVVVGERDTARTEFANARKLHIDDLIAGGLKAGTITAAEEADWRRRLGVEAQFANEHTAFKNLQPKVKTTSVTVNRGGKETSIDLSNATARAQFVNEEVANVAAELHLDVKKDYTKIYNIVQQRHPAVFAAMQKPASKN